MKKQHKGKAQFHIEHSRSVYSSVLMNQVSNMSPGKKSIPICTHCLNSNQWALQKHIKRELTHVQVCLQKGMRISRTLAPISLWAHTSSAHPSCTEAYEANRGWESTSPRQMLVTTAEAVWPSSQDLGIMVSSSNTNVIGGLDEAPNLVLIPTARWLFPSCEKTESTRFNKRSEWCRWETSDNDKQTADLFLKAKSVSQSTSYWLSSHPTRLWHSWSETWKLD